MFSISWQKVLIKGWYEGLPPQLVNKYKVGKVCFEFLVMHNTLVLELYLWKVHHSVTITKFLYLSLVTESDKAIDIST